MFESNFPVDKACVSYRTLWNAFKRITARVALSETEKTAILGGTAARAYRLTAPKKVLVMEVCYVLTSN